MSFQFETHAELTCLATNHGNGEMFAKKGSMVAYQGDFKFDKVLIDTNGGGILKGIANHAMRRVTGENLELMKVTGQGQVYLADEAAHVVIINLNQGDQISVESENLLAFNDACQYGVRFIGVGVVSQKGLFTSKLTPKAHGAQVAVKTDGNPIILQTPCVVDPDAVVCWTGSDPSFKLGLSWKTFIGQTSGESYMLEFKEPGYHVIVQPSERKSGVKIGIDDKDYTPQSQGSAFQNSQQNMQNTFNQVGQVGQQVGQFGQQFTGGQTGSNSQQSGGIGGIIGSILGNQNNRQ